MSIYDFNVKKWKKGIREKQELEGIVPMIDFESKLRDKTNERLSNNNTSVNGTNTDIPSIESGQENGQDRKERRLFRAVLGGAGTGKSTLIRKWIADYEERYPHAKRSFAVICATTGIAAINLGEGVGTVNSELGYYDTNDLEEKVKEGKITKAVLRIAEKAMNLVIDELSMMNAKQLSLLVQVFKQVNEMEKVKAVGGVGLIVTGDFCQLPPVPDKDADADSDCNKFAFECEEWEEFEIETLTKVHRQDNVTFLEALHAARKGDGDTCGRLLDELGVFHEEIDLNFDGVTILPTNRKVEEHNQRMLNELIWNLKYPNGIENEEDEDTTTTSDEEEGETFNESNGIEITLNSYRWGKLRGEWKEIPETLRLAPTALVMILANDGKQRRYANGSMGRVVKTRNNNMIVDVKLHGGPTVAIKRITRRTLTKFEPDGKITPRFLSYNDYVLKMRLNPKNDHDIEYESYLNNLTQQNKYIAGNTPGPYYDYKEKRWCIGEITYTPIRLAYASTVHKTQGLTLDKVQIDPYIRFFENPAMMYVALSRVRSPEGLRIVGDSCLVADRTNVATEVLRWI